MRLMDYPTPVKHREINLPLLYLLRMVRLWKTEEPRVRRELGSSRAALGKARPAQAILRRSLTDSERSLQRSSESVSRVEAAARAEARDAYWRGIAVGAGVVVVAGGVVLIVVVTSK